jgi:hypothetical protein
MGCIKLTSNTEFSKMDINVGEEDVYGKKVESRTRKIVRLSHYE